MIYATCFCGHKNSRANLEANLRCERCHGAIALNAWKTSTGLPADKALWDKECRTCGKEFKGEYWKTQCLDCYKRRKHGYQKITNS